MVDPNGEGFLVPTRRPRQASRESKFHSTAVADPPPFMCRKGSSSAALWAWQSLALSSFFATLARWAVWGQVQDHPAHSPFVSPFGGASGKGGRVPGLGAGPRRGQPWGSCAAHQSGPCQQLSTPATGRWPPLLAVLPLSLSPPPPPPLLQGGALADAAPLVAKAFYRTALTTTAMSGAEPAGQSHVEAAEA